MRSTPFEATNFLFFITISDDGVGIEAYNHEMSDDGVGDEVHFYEYVTNYFQTQWRDG